MISSSERVPFTMFVILLKWWKRRVGGKDYRVCWDQNWLHTTYDPQLRTVVLQGVPQRQGWSDAAHQVREGWVTHITYNVSSTVRAVIRSPFSDRLPSAEYVTLIGSGWYIFFGFQLRSSSLHHHYYRNRIRDLICGWIRPIQQGATLRVRNGVLGSPACSSFAELNRLAALPTLALCMGELFNQDYTIIVYLVTGLTNVVTNANMRFEGC